jgi:hypothetical protein
MILSEFSYAMIFRSAIPTFLSGALPRYASSVTQQCVAGVWQRYASTKPEVLEPKPNVERARPRIRWDPRDVEKLEGALAMGKSQDECAALFPGRSPCAIVRKSQMIRNNVAKNPINDTVRNIIALARQGLTSLEIKDAIPQAPLHSISNAAWRHGIKITKHSQTKRVFWSSSEDDIILRGYADGSKAETLAVLLPGRSISAIEERLRLAQKSGAYMMFRSPKRAYTYDEDVMLMKHLNSGKITETEVAQSLGRSIGSVRNRHRRLKVERKKQDDAVNIKG